MILPVGEDWCDNLQMFFKTMWSSINKNTHLLLVSYDMFHQPVPYLALPLRQLIS